MGSRGQGHMPPCVAHFSSLNPLADCHGAKGLEHCPRQLGLPRHQAPLIWVLIVCSFFWARLPSTVTAVKVQRAVGKDCVWAMEAATGPRQARRAASGAAGAEESKGEAPGPVGRGSGWPPDFTGVISVARSSFLPFLGAICCSSSMDTVQALDSAPGGTLRRGAARQTGKHLRMRQQTGFICAGSGRVDRTG